jgi:hypothetical protein
MLDSLSPAATGFVLIGLLMCLIAATIAFLWSIEDQRVKRRVSKRQLVSKQQIHR